MWVISVSGCWSPLAALAFGTLLSVAGFAKGDDIPIEEPVTQGPFQPSWESLQQYKCPDWFRDAKFGIWAHCSA
ncbi:MAG TPA: alpha-L-fucosidase, partial [Tepidisphaeraceae bacterium]|nr:alpha-L-fucosidase [Tepidisphaeraceae bacterium]